MKSDLAPVKEALSANEMVADGGLAEGGFNRARLDVEYTGRGWRARPRGCCARSGW